MKLIGIIFLSTFYFATGFASSLRDDFSLATIPVGSALIFNDDFIIPAYTEDITIGSIESQERCGFEFLTSSGRDRFIKKGTQLYVKEAANYSLGYISKLYLNDRQTVELYCLGRDNKPTIRVLKSILATKNIELIISEPIELKP